jgi:cell division control protein 24
MVLDRMEDQGLLCVRRTKRNSDPAKPTDNRAKVVQEILETERSFVQDLENLQSYMRALQTDGTVISPETIHLIFANLNALVDFQRRFLIAIETNAAFSPQDQNFGQCFLTHEEAFAVYEPFCANFNEASKLILAEGSKLQVRLLLRLPFFSSLFPPIEFSQNDPGTLLTPFLLSLCFLDHSTTRKWPILWSPFMESPLN